MLASVDLVTGGYVYPLERVRSDVGELYDFRGPWFGALDLAAGADPYRGDGSARPSDRLAASLGIERMATLYPPPVLTAVMPLTTLRFTRARVLALGFLFACALLAIPALLLAATPRPARADALAMLFLVGSFSELQRGLAMGQLHAPLLLLLAAGVAALARGRELTGGALLGLAVLIKPVPIVVLAGLGLGRRWRALAAALAALALALGASTALWGAAPLLGFLDAARDAARDVNVSRDNQSLQAALVRLAVDAPRNLDWSELPSGLRQLWLALSGFLLGSAAVLTALRRGSLSLQLSLLLTAGLLASPRAWHHYATWLLLPYAVLLWELARRESWGLVGLSAASYALVSHPARSAKLVGWLLPAPPAVLESAQCLGALLLWVALVAALLRSPREPPAAA